MIISAYGIKLIKEDFEVIKKLSKFLSKEFNEEIEIELKDVIHYENLIISKNEVLFGSIAYIEAFVKTIETKWILPDIKSLRKDSSKRKEVSTILKEYINLYKRQSIIPETKEQVIEEEIETFVEKNEVKFSTNKSIEGIILTEKEIENLLKLKQLLNGSKIIIRKGDISIEVER